MGEARRRGTYEQRKQDAIKSGRKKDNKIIRDRNISMHPLEAMAALFIPSNDMYFKLHKRR